MATSQRISESISETKGTVPKVSLFFVVLAGVFITCLLCANIVAVKLIYPFGLLVPAGTIVFPLSYLFGDVLTEVYGYGSARLVIWLGFFCNLLLVAGIYLAGILPAAPFWHEQAAYDTILGFAPRLLLGSFVAYIAGEFINSFVLAKLKIITKGRWLWSRTIGSTFLGQGVDTTIFISIAFWGILSFPLLVQTILTQWLFKVGYEIIATPFTYLAVNFLKRREGIDHYDIGTNFNPFLLLRGASGIEQLKAQRETAPTDKVM